MTMIVAINNDTGNNHYNNMIESTLGFCEYGDPWIIYSYIIGLGLGCVVLSILIIFPGKKTQQDEDNNYANENCNQVPDKSTTRTTTTILKSSDIIQLSPSPQQEEKEQPKIITSNQNDNYERNIDAWVGDMIPKEKLKKVQKMFGLTDSQMEQVMEMSRNESTTTTTKTINAESSSAWSPHQQLNMAMYAIMISILIVIFNKEYDNVVTYWFLSLFPKEAELLHITWEPSMQQPM